MFGDLQTIYLLVAITGGVLTLLGIIFGWFSQLWRLILGLFKRKKSSALIDVPKKTVILLPSQMLRPFWWHMGSRDRRPAMQVVGDLSVTNICKYDILPGWAKMRKPRVTGSVMVKDPVSGYYGEYFVPSGMVTELRFDFLIQPSVKKEGELFKADIAILDQFGNEHWLKGVEFEYS